MLQSISSRSHVHHRYVSSNAWDIGFPNMFPPYPRLPFFFLSTHCFFYISLKQLMLSLLKRTTTLAVFTSPVENFSTNHYVIAICESHFYCFFLVVSSYVKSIEDHGYMLRFGVNSFTGFMQKNSKDNKMVVGKLVQGVVKRIDGNCKVVNLSSDADEVAKCVTKDLKRIPFNLLAPGMMVNARVLSTLEMSSYFPSSHSLPELYVDVFHLGKTLADSKWKDFFKLSNIIFITPFSSPFFYPISDIFDDSKVIRVDWGTGLLLEIPSTLVPTPAYVNVS
ncbi:hypothetical protein L2E82_49964 [Cichorium intybus]|nr:hypothetical protein L2E82_49964 [Cichorium intybus]